jgi:hypothetical protein
MLRLLLIAMGKFPQALNNISCRLLLVKTLLSKGEKEKK